MSSLEKCLQSIPKRCLFVDLGSGTGNVLFLMQRWLSEDSQLIGVELNKDMFDESVRRSRLIGPEADNIKLWNQNIFDFPLDVIINSASSTDLPIVLFTFDALFPRELVMFIYNCIFALLPSGTMLISTWSPRVYGSVAGAAKVVELDHLFIGPPGVKETDSNTVINLALSPDNYEPELFERLDEAEQAKQMAAAKALSGKSELPVQMDEFPMFCYIR